MNDAAHEEDYKGYHIRIDYDQDPINPREDGGQLGKMICFHGRYTLGDKHSIQADAFSGWDAQEAYFEKEMGAVVMLPLYIYDHGGITMNTGGFSCPWDSGRVGTIIATKADILKEYGGQRITKRMIERATACLEAEVKTYDDYIRGSVYGYTITQGDDEAEVESCWGFLGDYDDEYGALSEARSIVDHTIAHELQKRMEQDLARTGLEE
jgi:hypothetical protein